MRGLGSIEGLKNCDWRGGPDLAHRGLLPPCGFADTGSTSANERYFVSVGVLHFYKTVSTTVEMGSIIPWYGMT